MVLQFEKFNCSGRTIEFSTALALSSSDAPQQGSDSVRSKIPKPISCTYIVQNIDLLHGTRLAKVVGAAHKARFF